MSTFAIVNFTIKYLSLIFSATKQTYFSSLTLLYNFDHQPHSRTRAFRLAPGLARLSRTGTLFVSILQLVTRQSLADSASLFSSSLSAFRSAFQLLRYNVTTLPRESANKVALYDEAQHGKVTEVVKGSASATEGSSCFWSMDIGVAVTRFLPPTADA